jgi:hypothetical protein
MKILGLDLMENQLIGMVLAGRFMVAVESLENHHSISWVVMSNLMWTTEDQNGV